MANFDEHPNYRELFESLGFEYRGCDSYATYSVDVFPTTKKSSMLMLRMIGPLELK